MNGREQKDLPPGYELRSGYGPNYYHAYYQDKLIAASSDREFVLARIEAHNTQREAA